MTVLKTNSIKYAFDKVQVKILKSHQYPVVVSPIPPLTPNH